MNRQVRLVAAGLALVFVVSGCSLFEDRRSFPRTRVEVMARPIDGAPVTPEGMADAAGVMEVRLEADGHPVTDVVVDDATITLEFEGDLGEETRALISEPGDLSFRPVLALGAPGPDGGPEGQDRTGVAPEVWAQFEAVDCTAPQSVEGGADPELPLVTCGRDGDAKYVLGPVEVSGAQLVDAQAADLPGADGTGADWGVALQLDDGGTEAFRETTERLQALDEPRNLVAITLDDLVLSAPSIAPGVVITTGLVEIAGSFTEESATTLARQLASDPLPYPFEVRDVATTD